MLVPEEVGAEDRVGCDVCVILPVFVPELLVVKLFVTVPELVPVTVCEPVLDEE